MTHSNATVRSTADVYQQHRSIFNGMLLVAGFLLLSKSVGALKEALVAARYGVSDLVDAYLFSFSLTQAPVGIIGGAMTSLLVPLLATDSCKNEHRLRLMRRLTSYTITAGIGLAVISHLAFPILIRQGFFGLSHSQISRTTFMVSAMSLVIPASLLSRLFAASLMAHNQHRNTLFECLPSLGILFCLILIPGDNALLVGGCLGIVAESLLLAILVSLSGDLVVPQFSVPTVRDARHMKTAAVVVVSHALLGMGELVDQLLGARLAGGSLATMGYANRVLALPLGLAATTIGRSMLPVLSRHQPQHSNTYAWFVSQWVIVVTACGTIGMGLLILFAEQFVRFLFERGHFGAAETMRVTLALQWGASRIPFYLATIVVMYGITSVRRTKPLLVIGVVAFVTKLITSAALLPSLGLEGLLLSSTCVYALTSCVGLWMLWVADDVGPCLTPKRAAVSCSFRRRCP